MIKCFSCKASFADVRGEDLTHRYMLSSPGCWQVYGEVLSKEYSSRSYWQNHRLTVDAYAVQHPGVENSQSIQSVAVHLLSLYFVLEKGFSHDQAREVIGKAVRLKFDWLIPPDNLGMLTVKDVWNAKSAHEHNQRVEQWAHSVWVAWKVHHIKIEKWASQVVIF